MAAFRTQQASHAAACDRHIADGTPNGALTLGKG